MFYCAQLLNDRIQDEALLSKLNPQNLHGQEKNIFGYEFRFIGSKIYFLNSYYRKENTPQRYKDWLDLIYESINNPENSHINISNQGIKKASELIDKDMLTNEELTLMKEYEGRKVVIQIEREEGKKEGLEIGLEKGKFQEKTETIINGNKEGLSSLILSKLTGLNINEVEEIIDSQILITELNTNLRQEDKEK